MIFRQLTFPATGCASYLIGCPASGEAAVIDPLAALGADEYLLEAADQGLAIRYVVETHSHADHLSAGRELAAMAGATYCLGRRAPAAGFPFRKLEDGEVLRVGRIDLTVLETPGHTPDSITLAVTDHARSDDPWFLLTGDALFVGDVGRPDLLVGDAALDVHDESARARELFRSLHEKILTFPDHVEVYPGHFGGSACGGVNMSGKASSTIAFERRFNLALAHPDADAFAAFVRSTLRPLPDDYTTIKRRNLGLLPDGARPANDAGTALAPADVRAALAAGAVPVDLRSAAVAAASHIPGAVMLSFSREALVRRARALLPQDRPLVLVADPAALGAAAGAMLRNAGFAVAGYLGDGMDAWHRADLPVASLPTVTVEELHTRLAAGEDARLRVLDVREPHEHAGGHIPGALNRPHAAVGRWAADLDRDHHWYVACNTQNRSGAAASVMRRLGFPNVTLVLGGWAAWSAAGLPVEAS